MEEWVFNYASNAFSNKNEASYEQEKATYEEKIERIYNTIGQFTVDVTWLKKTEQALGMVGKKELVTKDDSKLSVSRQCKLLNFNRSSVYYKEREESRQEIAFKHIVDQIHTDHPSWGTRRIAARPNDIGYPIGRNLVRCYMKEMRIYAIYQTLIYLFQIGSTRLIPIYYAI